jgi:hypothetical protein
VRKIGSYTGSIDDIVKGELRDEWASLEKEGKWLFEEIDMSVISIRSRVGIPLLEEDKSTWPIPPEAPATTVMDDKLQLTQIPLILLN